MLSHFDNEKILVDEKDGEDLIHSNKDNEIKQDTE